MAHAQCQILYGIPLPPSQVERLGRLGKRLGKGSISVLIDNVSQLQLLRSFHDVAGFGCEIYIKINTGYGRAGVTTDSPGFKHLVQSILSEIEPSGCGSLHGFYSHAGHSYGGDSPVAAMSLLVQEIAGLKMAATTVTSMNEATTNNRQYVLSVGATPTATSIQNLFIARENSEGNDMNEQLVKLHECIEDAKRTQTVEIHAGVYPILDTQQVATDASPSARTDNRQDMQTSLSTADIALTILAEVASVYDDRGNREALMAAGSLALGREPCKSYDGWGIVSDWGMATPIKNDRSGWQVGRISQEHGILMEDSSVEHPRAPDLHYGQKIRIWPNHACVTGAGFGWYLVVDSSLPEGRRDEIVDVWVRCRGW